MCVRVLYCMDSDIKKKENRVCLQKPGQPFYKNVESFFFFAFVVNKKEHAWLGFEITLCTYVFFVFLFVNVCVCVFA